MTLAQPERSRANLEGVHADLVRVIQAAAIDSSVPFLITEGVRTKKRQRELVGEGKSWTMNSRHLTGHAVDIAVLDEEGNVTWEWPYYREVADQIRRSAELLDVSIVWGGDWTKRDGVHFELERNAYPAKGDTPSDKRRDVGAKAGAAAGAGAVASWVATDPSAAAGLLSALQGLDWRVGVVAVSASLIGFVVWLGVRRWRG